MMTAAEGSMPARKAAGAGIAGGNRPRRTRQAGLAAFALLAGLAGMAHAADGDPDPGFSGDGIATLGFAGGSIENVKLAVDASGRVLAGGTITRTGMNKDFAIGRLQANGATDFDFGFQGLRTVGFDFVENGSDRLHAIIPQDDGRILLLGVAEVADENPASAPPALARLTAGGNPDATFGTNGRMQVGGHPWANPTLYISQATRQRDGKLLLGGYCNGCPGTYHAVVIRLTANGAPDPSFGTNGWASMPLSVSNPRFEAIAVDDLGRIVLAGTQSSSGVYRPLVARMTATGAPDPGFGGGTGVVTIPLLPSPFFENAVVRAVAIERGHAMVLALGNFTPATPEAAGLVRLFADGTRDTLYAVNGLRNLTLEDGSRIHALAMRSDRRVVAAGWIRHTGGNQDFLLARVMPDGALDNSFDGNGLLRLPVAETHDGAEAMTLAAGKPVLAGFMYTSQRDIAVLRMQSDLLFSDGME